jgi:5-methylcytosine-specific restriction endonuclease McrA
VSRTTDSGAIAFAERLLVLLDEASYSTTYKPAVLLGLLDLCIEHAAKNGAAPQMLTTRQLAHKVVEIYWPQTRDYHSAAGLILLRQSNTGRADIVTKVRAFREEQLNADVATLHQARANAPAQYKQLVADVEWVLIKYPLPRLQRLGNVHEQFIYDIGWDQGIAKPSVTAYQCDQPSDFNNAILLQGFAGDYLVQFGPLLRPLVQRVFTERIVRYNGKVLADHGIEAFLFETQRTPTAPLRQALRDLQAGDCFYCRRSLASSKTEIDHFVPFCRYPDDTLDNLVLAHHTCNNDKRHYIASAEHVGHWRARHDDRRRELQQIASDTNWAHEPERTLAVARSIYLHLPATARLWHGRGEFVGMDRGALEVALG